MRVPLRNLSPFISNGFFYSQPKGVIRRSSSSCVDFIRTQTQVGRVRQ